jgi:hypothetical protein
VRCAGGQVFADHSTAKAIYGVFGNNEWLHPPEESECRRRMPHCQKLFDLSFERQQQRELAWKFGVAAGKLLEVEPVLPRMNFYRS